MTNGGAAKKAFADIAGRLKADLAELIEAATAKPPSSAVRKRLDSELRGLVEQVDHLLRDLDPVRQPRFMFDPGNPSVVGRFIALAMISQPRAGLLSVECFYGSGVYALYYDGNFSAYAAISGSETPIYVGKADPASDTARRPAEQGERLCSRLRDHRRNIGKAGGSLRIEDFRYRSLVVQSGWQGAAEDYLINLFKPVWNSESNICYGLGKHGDDPKTRANLRCRGILFIPAGIGRGAIPTWPMRGPATEFLAISKRTSRLKPFTRTLIKFCGNSLRNCANFSARSAPRSPRRGS